ncbi:MAG TPA: TetR-like C-terminal domain-containing protein [Solirubrobacterales bacterium]
MRRRAPRRGGRAGARGRDPRARRRLPRLCDRAPGRYATTVRAPARDDEEAQTLATRGLAPIYAVLAGWGIEGDQATHLVRVIRSALHGFVSLEQGGGFGIPLQIDESFDLLVDSLVAAIQAAAPA